MSKLIVLGIFMSLLTGCATATMPPSDAEALYQKRFEIYKAGNLSGVYDFMEPVVGATTAQPLPVATQAQRTINAGALAQAADYARRNNSTAFLVWRAGHLEDARYFGDARPGAPLNALSFAKPLAVIAIGRAIMLGDIKSMDEPVADFIQEWRGTPKSKILIRNLLQMSSGLQNQAFTYDSTTVMNRAYLHPLHDQILIRDYPLTDKPGTRFAYSNATAELAAIIIERATGRRYARFLSDEILMPLGASGGTVWIDRPQGVAHSGCCIFLPAETWLRLGILILQNGAWDGQQLLSPDFVHAMVTPTPLNPYAGMMAIYIAGRYTARRGFSGPGQPGPQVLHSEPYLAADLVLFDGNADQVVYIIPSAKLVALRMGSAPQKKPEWDNTKIPNILLRGIGWHSHPPTPQGS